ncbi:protein SCAF8 [Galendromus occidentalis]|uniref:Protein SCAF8 n=1 Tax=Galendromus occidentalis TaxID=34638 RepID=A0AAJ7L8F8_9ACAR|nr:protein SCAF8 [Galendromus occidentalis]
MKNEAAMEEVKAFNAELQTLYESRPPVSKAKMTDITKRAMKGVKLYKHVVHTVEKFIHKCKPEYKVPGLYVIDSIVRQSRHQFGSEKDVFAPRFQKNIKNTFQSLMRCPDDQRPKIVRVLNLWQKNGVFPTEVTQMLHEVVASCSGQNPMESVRNGDDVNVGEDPSLASKTSTLANQIKEQSKENKPVFDRKLLDFDYGEEEEDKSTSDAGHHHHHHHHHHHQPTHPPEPPKVEDVQKIANTVLNPSMLESIQKALAAQGMGQILKPEMPSDMGMQMVPPPNHMMASPFGLPMMVANPFATPVPMQPPVSQEADLMVGKDEDLRNKEDGPRRRRSRSPRRRSRSRSRSPARSRRRSRDRKRDRSSSADREHERERMSKGLPAVRRGYITVCSNTLWLGHVSKATTESDLEASFGEHGKILSIDLIPPRGCAYICMDRRQDAYRTLVNKRNIRLKNSPSRIKIAWAPHKGAKNHKNFKDYWDVDQGCFFIPDDQMPLDVDLAQLEEGGMIDVDSLPDSLKKRYELLKMGGKPPSAIPNAMPTGIPGGIPMPFGVPPFPMASMGAPGSNALTAMLGMPPMALPPMMLNPNMLRPPGGTRMNLPGAQGSLPPSSTAAAVAPPPPISAQSPSANGDARGPNGQTNFGPPGPRNLARGAMPQMRGPGMPGMPPMSNMPRHMLPRRGHMMGGPMPRPPSMRNGPDGSMDGPDGMPPRFGMPGPDFLARHGPPPPNWNGPPGGPMWRHGLPPGMRPDFSRGPLPPNFNGPPPMGNFPNGSPLGLMGARPPQAGTGSASGSVGVSGPEKRQAHEESSIAGGRERKRRSRWSDAPGDAPAVPPPVLANLPPVIEPEAATEVQAEASADEPGTPVADETEWPDKAPGEDFDMFNDSPKVKAS